MPSCHLWGALSSRASLQIVLSKAKSDEKALILKHTAAKKEAVLEREGLNKRVHELEAEIAALLASSTQDKTRMSKELQLVRRVATACCRPGVCSPPARRSCAVADGDGGPVARD